MWYCACCIIVVQASFVVHIADRHFGKIAARRVPGAMVCKRIRGKQGGKQANGKDDIAASSLKSPDPKKLRQAAEALKKDPASASTTTSSPPILKRSTSTEAIRRKLSFGTPTVHDIQAENPGKTPERKMTPERAKEVLAALKVSEGSDSEDDSMKVP